MHAQSFEVNRGRQLTISYPQVRRCNVNIFSSNVKCSATSSNGKCYIIILQKILNNLCRILRFDRSIRIKSDPLTARPKLNLQPIIVFHDWFSRPSAKFPIYVRLDWQCVTLSKCSNLCTQQLGMGQRPMNCTYHRQHTNNHWSEQLMLWKSNVSVNNCKHPCFIFISDHVPSFPWIFSPSRPGPSLKRCRRLSYLL